MNEQDTGKQRINMKDQFYTKVCIARECIQSIKKVIKDHRSHQWIEPSAGNGSFITKNCIALDIDPKHKKVLKQDFLEYNPSIDKPIIIYGNPPFGKQSSTAKKFIKHAASFASVIAFILPRSFVKPSMNKAFPKHFHCIYTKELEKDSFEVNGEPYNVACIFQIWQKGDEIRLEELCVQPVGFIYVKQTDSYDVSVRRVGINAGTTLLKDKNVSAQSHYFIKLENINKKDRIVEQMNAHTFPSNTVGPRSLSKGEINVVLNELVVKE